MTTTSNVIQGFLLVTMVTITMALLGNEVCIAPSKNCSIILHAPGKYSCCLTAGDQFTDDKYYTPEAESPSCYKNVIGNRTMDILSGSCEPWSNMAQEYPLTSCVPGNKSVTLSDPLCFADCKCFQYNISLPDQTTCTADSAGAENFTHMIETRFGPVACASGPHPNPASYNVPDNTLYMVTIIVAILQGLKIKIS